MNSRTQHNDPTGTGSLGLAYHYEMLADKERVAPFRHAIERTCAGRRVLESGTGSAIFSILAAKAGAAHVYAVEVDPVVARFAQENIRKSGYEKLITLINKDALDITLADLDGERAQVVIAENLSTWQVTEPQILLMNYINVHLLTPHAVHIPEGVSNYLELAHTNYRFEDVVDLRTHYFIFTGLQEPLILSERVLFEKVDFSQQCATTFQKKVMIEATSDGIGNSLRLTSPVQVYQDISFGSSDSLMPPVVVPLEEDITVKKGDSVEITVEYTVHTKWESFRCKAKVV